jgi:hypothetical protein
MKNFMRSNGLGMFVVMLIGALVGSMIITAMPADAGNQGNILFKNRYFTTSTTPIDDIDQLNGVTSNVQTQLDATASSSLADTKIYVGSAAGLATAQTVGGDATMANSGAVTLAANSVSVSQLFINSVTLTVANTATYNSVTVDSGHELMGYYISTLGGINGTNLINDVYYEGSGVWSIGMVNALQGGAATWTLNFVSDN